MKLKTSGDVLIRSDGKFSSHIELVAQLDRATAF